LASSCRIDTLDVSNFLLFRRSRNSRASQRGSSSPLVGPHSRFLVFSRRTPLAVSRLLLSTCSRFLVSSRRLLTVPRVLLASSCRIDTLDVSNFPYSAELEIRGQVNAVPRLLSSDPTRGSSSPLVGPHS